MAKDPVCKMEVDEKKAAKEKYEGRTYYFCSPSCQWAFKEKPEEFVGKE
jgi:YHS domain-containing protein